MLGQGFYLLMHTARRVLLFFGMGETAKGSALGSRQGIHPLHPEANEAGESMQISSGDANTRIANISLCKGLHHEYSWCTGYSLKLQRR